jgi:hypothetical protein
VNKDLIDLREKYLRLRELRASKAHREPEREELREVSRRWPGALAEIDRLSPDVLEHRIAALEEAIAGGEPPLWARAWILAHRRLRGALAIKMWLAGRREITALTRASLNDAALPNDAALYLDRLDEIAHPPNGRLSELVFGDVARELSLPASEMRALLMPREPIH